MSGDSSRSWRLRPPLAPPAGANLLRRAARRQPAPSECCPAARGAGQPRDREPRKRRDTLGHTPPARPCPAQPSKRAPNAPRFASPSCGWNVQARGPGGWLTSDVDGVRVLILTTFGLDDSVYEALRAGAKGFVLKDAPPEELLAAIEVVARGHALIAPA